MTSKRVTTPPPRQNLPTVIHHAVNKTPGRGVRVELYNKDEWTYYAAYDADGDRVMRGYWNNSGEWTRDFLDYGNKGLDFSEPEVRELYTFVTAERARFQEGTPLIIWASYLTAPAPAPAAHEEVTYSDFAW